LVLALLAGGSALSYTGIAIGWRLVLRKVAR